MFSSQGARSFRVEKMRKKLSLIIFLLSSMAGWGCGSIQESQSLADSDPEFAFETAEDEGFEDFAYQTDSDYGRNNYAPTDAEPVDIPPTFAKSGLQPLKILNIQVTIGEDAITLEGLEKANLAPHVTPYVLICQINPDAGQCLEGDPFVLAPTRTGGRFAATTMSDFEDENLILVAGASETESALPYYLRITSDTTYQWLVGFRYGDEFVYDVIALGSSGATASYLGDLELDYPADEKSADHDQILYVCNNSDEMVENDCPELAEAPDDEPKVFEIEKEKPKIMVICNNENDNPDDDCEDAENDDDKNPDWDALLESYFCGNPIVPFDNNLPKLLPPSP